MGYDRTKLRVLQFVVDKGQVSAQDVSKELGLEIHNARMCLLAYHRQGLLSRSSFYGLHKVYSLTKKGLERLLWLKKEFEG
jgi:predicted ArsR family transcriptional regulator